MTQPNILFLLPDQLRPDFLGCYGADFLRTPAIDALAASGTRFDTAISPSPICVPARASMLTGQHAHATGITHNLAWLRPDRRQMGIMTWPEHLARAGYRTAAIGKMHFYPWDLSEGFQARVVSEDKRHIHIADDYHHALRAEGFVKEHARGQPGYTAQKGASTNPLPDHLQPDRWVADRAAEHIRAMTGDQPFAMMVGFPGPHCPYDPPAAALARVDRARMPPALSPTDESRSHHAEFVAGYRREWADLDYTTLTAEQVRTIRHHYAVLVERLDEDVATILDALRESGRLDNTIVVFASDHGDYLGDFGMVGKAWFHEPSIRVPLIVSDFRAPRSTVERAPVTLLDIMPTFLDWAGVAPSIPLDGRRLSDPDPLRVIVGMTSHGMMARDSRWKLVRYGNGTEALFDVFTDPDEQQNRIMDAPAERARLDAELTASLLAGFSAGHVDKVVRDVKADAPHPFHHPFWQRSYPAKFS